MTVRENAKISGLRWMTLSGSRSEVFHALGQTFSQEISSVLYSMPEREALMTWQKTRKGSNTVEKVLGAAERDYLDGVEELNFMAEGSGVPFEELFLANIRGDAGSYDGTGCTDILWNGTSAYAAHNEDGAPSVGRNLTLLTIQIKGEQPIFTQWYPGFLPCNAYTLTASGLAWGINHIPVKNPAPYAGRHFVARRLQRSRTIDEALGFLRTHPMAGGFSFNFASPDAQREVTVECAAGKVVDQAADGNHPYRWHTNHLLYMDGNQSVEQVPHDNNKQSIAHALGPMDESIRRGEQLKADTPNNSRNILQWLFSTMSEHELPEGVYRTARGDDPLETLCTTVYDLANRRLHIRGHEGPIETWGEEALVGNRL